MLTLLRLGFGVSSIERAEVQIPTIEINLEVFAPPMPTRQLGYESTQTVECECEDETTRERPGHPPSYAKAKKMQSLTPPSYAKAKKMESLTFHNQAFSFANNRWTKNGLHRIKVTIFRNHRNRHLGISRVPLKSQEHQGTSLFTSTATNQRGCPKGSPPHIKLRSDFQMVFWLAIDH